MVNGTTTVLEPTFTGYVASTRDALILFEACLTGVLHHVPRRPHDRERSHLVRSGSVFIYEENSSGIKRWTDGVTWSPSRILGNFLVYRELEKPFPPGEKKRAMKKTTRRPPLPTGRPGEPYPRQDTTNGSYSPSSTGSFAERTHQSDVERALVGSLVDSYGFKESGLVKKTMSVTVSGVTHHLVSYYSVEDVMHSSLVPPSAVEGLKFIRPRPELTQKQNFRAPIDDMETVSMENPNDPSHPLFPYRTQMVPTQPYPMQTPQTDFYMQTNAYVPATHPSQSASIAGFSLGGPISGQHSYLPTPTPPTQISHPQKQDEYSQFRGQPSYGTGFDPLGHGPLSSSSIPGSLPSSISDRARSQSDQSQAAYRSSISSRSVATDATSPVDPSTPATYSQRSSFSLGGHLDGAAHPPLDHRNLSFDATVPRRESNPVPAQYYPRTDQHQYYINATAPPTHANYPVTAWTTAAPAQPQI
ncbi:camp independent regulatory protein [Aspergillus lucknowensis]|uniref:Gti1/Pac2 family-domain-containing protein n=1 Tax=Aspergillus lucknowensis TaxID=176173 RepID=A0ABR4M410_9EURO